MKGQRFALHCVGFKHFGEWEGLSELLAALGSCKSGCSSCFADASEQGVSPRIEVGGLTWFALALRSPGCSCFCLRLDFQVTVSVRGGSRESTLGAFSTRTLKSSGVPAKRVQAGGFCVGMLTLACSTPACPGLVVVRFRGVHRSGFWGCCFPLKISLWLSCLHCVGLQHLGSGRGFRSRGLLAASGFTQVWLSFVFYRVLVLAVRLEVRVCVALRLQLFLRMRFRLLYLGLCAWPPCCRSTVGVVVFLDLSGSVRARDGSRSRGTT